MRPVSRPAVVLLAVGVALLVAFAPVAGGPSPSGRYALATMAFAAVCWVSGALPLPVTALLVPVFLTAFGVYPDVSDALAGFADPVVFLLLAGFVLATAVQKHGVDRRVAFHVLAAMGTSPRRLVLAVMVATALLSMLVSNTATTAMMVPVALGLADEVVGPEDPAEASNLRVSMLLGTAYAATVGGVGTLVGTPPNAIVVGAIDRTLGLDVTFVDWLAVGLPLVALTLPAVWLLLTVVVYPPADRDVSAARDRAREHLRTAGPLSPAGRRTVAVFAATAGLWVLGGLGFLFGWLPVRWRVTLFGGAGPSLFGPGGHEGLLYFVVVGLAAIPVLVLGGCLDWADVEGIDWGTLLLLGGGISLANGLGDTDALTWLAGLAVDSLAGSHLLAVLFVVVVATILVGELASNTAMAAVLAPLLISVGPAYAAVLGTGEATASALLAVAGAVAASYGFALPVATPPNAIVYGTGAVTDRQMLRAGVVLDAVIAVLVTGAVYVAIRTVWPLVL
ncbi:MAG: DASS family sodium-coupled anion symporter [Halobacteriaceae archaeon]